MAKAILTERAKNDIYDIWLYIANESMRAADDVMERLLKRTDDIADTPGQGRERPEFGPGIHGVVEARYLILYRIRTDGVYVMRFIHGARDFENVRAEGGLEE